MSDIESMFHQVEVAPDHCDALRFLWWPGNDMEREPQDCWLKVFLFGAVCSPGCAGYALRRTAQDNEGLFPLEVALREGEVCKGPSVRCNAFSTGPRRQVESRVQHIWFQSEG